MRRIKREALNSASLKTLQTMQAKVDAHSTPAKEADRLWKRKGGTKPRAAAFEDVRQKLRLMASGRERCMYCEDSEGTAIDHFWPKSSYPASAFHWTNYLWACSHCNSNEKRSQCPLDVNGRALLLDPTSVDPYAHLAFVHQTGEFVGVTAYGKETEKVFGLNRRATLQRGRAQVWTQLVALLREFAGTTDTGMRARIRDCIRDLSFQAVVQHFFRDALAGRDSVPKDLRSLVSQTQSEWSWAL